MRTIAAAATFIAAASGLAREGPTAAKAKVKPTLTDNLLDRFIVVPEHKLLFCRMEKVACMNFNELFWRVRAKDDPNQLKNGNGWYKNSPHNHNLTKADLEELLVDDSWHKAVFWRDPVERFVSGFQSKCGHADDDGAMHCTAQFGVPELPFDSSVNYMMREDYNAALKGSVADDSKDDEHFKRMGSFCGGLNHTLQYYDTVEELDVRTAHEKVSKLLTSVGVDPAGIGHLGELFPPPGDYQHAATQPSETGQTGYHHNTNASASMAVLFPENQPWLRNTLIDHYKSDFQLFSSAETAFQQGAPEASADWKWPLEDTMWQP